MTRGFNDGHEVADRTTRVAVPQSPHNPPGFGANRFAPLCDLQDVNSAPEPERTSPAPASDSSRMQEDIAELRQMVASLTAHIRALTPTTREPSSVKPKRSSPQKSSRKPSKARLASPPADPSDSSSSASDPDSDTDSVRSHDSDVPIPTIERESTGKSKSNSRRNSRRSSKLLPRVTPLSDGISPKPVVWKMAILHRFSMNADHYPSELDKMNMVLEATEGAAQEHLYPRMANYGTSSGWKSAKQMIQSVIARFHNPTEAVEAASDYRHLRMTKDFNSFADFKEEFLRLATLGEVKPSHWRGDMHDKISGRLRNAIASLEPTKELRSFESYCERLHQVDWSLRYTEQEASLARRKASGTPDTTSSAVPPSTAPKSNPSSKPTYSGWYRPEGNHDHRGTPAHPPRTSPAPARTTSGIPPLRERTATPANRLYNITEDHDHANGQDHSNDEDKQEVVGMTYSDPNDASGNAYA